MTVSEVADVIIIGGGIAGLTAALASARQALSVIIVHSARPGEASRAAAGMLAPSVEGLPANVLSIALAARDMYPGFLAELRETSGVVVPLDRNGIIELAASETDLADKSACAGPHAEILDTCALAELEPSFARHAGALLHPADGSVDNVLLMRALEQAVHHEQRVRRVAANVSSLI